jgi:propanol-preferring alcohol dehydrogenase
MIPYQELVLRDVRVQGTVICSPDDAKEMVAVLPSMGPGIVQTTLFHGLESISSLVELVSTGGISGKAIVIIDGSQL